MKIVIACLFFCFLSPIAATAQTRQKAETAFLAELNNILKNSREQHWRYKGAMTIDSAFAIDKNGVLSITVRYTEDADVVITRMEAPVKNINQVAYDLYLILEFKGDEVSAYESETNSKILHGLGKSNYFHIGVPVKDGYKQQEKLQKLLDNLLKYYKN